MERPRITAAGIANAITNRDVRDVSSCSGREILLLDDDEASLRLLQGLLEAAGYECIATRRPEDALASVVANHSIDVIVSDICMPDIDGLMFLDRLKGLRINRPLPQVLFLTGQPSIDNAIAALRRGAVDFLTKPLKPRELLEAVRRACDNAPHSASAVVSDQGAVLALAEQAAELADRLRLLSAPAAVQVSQQRHDAAMGMAARASRVHGAHVEHVDEACHLLDTIELLRSVRSSYGARLGEMDDAAWDLLMEVLRSDRSRRQVSVSGLSISIAGVSPTTALRRIHELVDRGHLHRIPDPTDARRDFVTVTATTAAVLTEYLEQVAERLAQRSHM